ncbi:MAG: hypothetical protein LC648_05925 [Novosphingobium sp.]|nr:hypothetical protein [Novosphingobium sp.]
MAFQGRTVLSIFRIAARAAAVLAVSAMIAPPALATRTVPIAIPLSARPAPLPAWSPADDTANNHRWRRHRDRGSTVGNVLTGLLVIGGIAAVAKAIDKDQEKRRRDRTQGRDYPYRDGPYRDGPYDYRDDRDVARDGSFGRGDSRAADRAVDACAAEAERSGRVDEIFDVDNVAGEWRVKGDYSDGREFTCTVDRSGRAYVGLEDRAEVGRDPRAWDEPGEPDADDRYATGPSPDIEDSRR